MKGKVYDDVSSVAPVAQKVDVEIDGVHGPSPIVDHQAFPWQDRLWQARPLSAAVMYELHIGTFTPAGTFEAAIERLDHLVDLGITHVELMPVNEFSGSRGGAMTASTSMPPITTTAARMG